MRLIFRPRIAWITFRQPLDDETVGAWTSPGRTGLSTQTNRQLGRLAKLEVALMLGEKHCLSLCFSKTRIRFSKTQVDGQPVN
jgi:hypothetical protein